MTTYREQLILERQDKQRATRAWIECFIVNHAPSYEQCKAHFDAQGMTISKHDYQEVCKKMSKSHT